MQTLTMTMDRPRPLIRGARARRLGSLFVPTRRAYLVIMPAILFAGALVGWAAGSDISMVIAAFLMTAVSAYLFFDLLGRRAPLRMTTILAATLGLAYGLGTLNTWFTLPRGDETLGEFLQISTADLAHTMASCCVSIAILLVVGELYETPLFGEEFELRFDMRSVILVTLGMLVIAASFATGHTGFMGASVQETGAEAGHVGVLASLAAWLAGPLLACAVCMALNLRESSTRLYMRGMSVLLFVLIFPLGRRVIIYSVILSLIGLRLGRYKIPYSPLRKAVYLGLLGSVVYAASVGFFYLRVAGYSMVKPTLLQRVSGAVDLAHTKSYAEIKEMLSKNVETRTFILGFLAQIEGYTDTMPAGYGADFMGQFQLAAPSILFPGKDLFFTEEALVNTLFGSNFPDQANSVFTAGAVDFGIWGIFFYPVIFAFMVRFFLELLAESLPNFTACFIVLASVAALLEPEVALTEYFVVLRNGVFFGGGIAILMALPQIQLRRDT
jgi:hypothetical protein